MDPSRRISSSSSLCAEPSKNSVFHNVLNYITNPKKSAAEDKSRVKKFVRLDSVDPDVSCKPPLPEVEAGGKKDEFAAKMAEAGSWRRGSPKDLISDCDYQPAGWSRYIAPLTGYSPQGYEQRLRAAWNDQQVSLQPQVQEQRLRMDWMEPDPFQPLQEQGLKMAWNVATQRYEYFPVMHHSVSYPGMTHPDPYHYLHHLDDHQPCPSHSQSDSGLRSYLWTSVCNIAENFLVQILCDQTHAGNVSQEVLAKSKLNPLAKEFTPKQLQNEEQMPSKVLRGEEQYQSKDSTAKELTRGEVKRTEGVSEEFVLVKDVPAVPGGDVIACPSEDPDVASAAGSAGGGTATIVRNSFCYDDEDDDDSDGGDESDEKGLLIPRNSSGDFAPSSCSTENSSLGSLRSRSLSECSEDSFVQFKADFNCDIDNDDVTDDDSDPSDDEDDDDDDWDTVDGSGHCIELSEEEFLETSLASLSLSSPLFNPSSSPCRGPLSVEGHPDARHDRAQLRRRVREVNRRWDQQFLIATSPAASSCCVLTSSRKQVCWADEADWLVIVEPEELFEALKEARESDLLKRQADRERRERILGPVLTKEHREKVYSRLYGTGEDKQ